MRNAVEYRGVLLMPGSHARQLHDEKKFKELDQHMKELDLKELRLRGELPEQLKGTT